MKTYEMQDTLLLRPALMHSCGIRYVRDLPSPNVMGDLIMGKHSVNDFIHYIPYIRNFLLIRNPL